MNGMKFACHALLLVSSEVSLTNGLQESLGGPDHLHSYLVILLRLLHQGVCQGPHRGRGGCGPILWPFLYDYGVLLSMRGGRGWFPGQV